MTFQIAAPLTHRSLSASNRLAREVARLAQSGELDLTPPYQRGSRWTYAQRLGLIRSWMTGVPIPAILINDRGTSDWVATTGHDPLKTGKGFYVAVDGKQRIETARDWFFGDLAVPASWFPADAVATTQNTDDGPYVTNAGLTEAAQRHFTNRAMLPTIEANAYSLAEEADLYLLINGAGTPQTQADLDNAARYSSEM